MVLIKNQLAILLALPKGKGVFMKYNNRDTLQQNKALITQINDIHVLKNEYYLYIATARFHRLST